MSGKNLRVDGAMQAAMLRTGAIQYCRLHPDRVKPCSVCGHAFKMARQQVKARERAATKAAHEAYKKAGGQ